MTSNCSAKRTSKEAERENARHCRQKEEERVDSRDQDELHRRDQPALLVEPLHRDKNVDCDDREQEERHGFAWCDLSKAHRTDQSDEGKSVNAQREYEVIDKIKVFAAAKMKQRQQERIKRQEKKESARQPIGQRTIQCRRIGHQSIQASVDLRLPPAYDRIVLLSLRLECVQ